MWTRARMLLVTTSQKIVKWYARHWLVCEKLASANVISLNRSWTNLRIDWIKAGTLLLTTSQKLVKCYAKTLGIITI